MTTPRLGVMGGMGPLATVIFMQHLVRLTQAEDDQDHLPMIVLNDPTVPSRIQAIRDPHAPSPAARLRDMATSLEAQGATALAMPCNTAHYFVEPLKSAVTIPFFDMISLTVEALRREQGTTKVGMLISPACREARVFEDAFAPVGFEPVYPENDHRLMNIIRTIKADGVSDNLVTAYLAIADELVSASSPDVVVVGCTELSCMPLPCRSELRVLDTMDVLARHVIGTMLGADRLMGNEA